MTACPGAGTVLSPHEPLPEVDDLSHSANCDCNRSPSLMPIRGKTMEPREMMEIPVRRDKSVFPMRPDVYLESPHNNGKPDVLIYDGLIQSYVSAHLSVIISAACSASA